MTYSNPACDFIDLLDDENRRWIVDWAVDEPDPVRRYVGLFLGVAVAGTLKRLAKKQLGCARAQLMPQVSSGAWVLLGPVMGLAVEPPLLAPPPQGW